MFYETKKNQKSLKSTPIILDTVCNDPSAVEVDIDVLPKPTGVVISLCLSIAKG